MWEWCFEALLPISNLLYYFLPLSHSVSWALEGEALVICLQLAPCPSLVRHCPWRWGHKHLLYSWLLQALVMTAACRVWELACLVYSFRLDRGEVLFCIPLMLPQCPTNPRPVGASSFEKCRLTPFVPFKAGSPSQLCSPTLVLCCCLLTFVLLSVISPMSQLLL